MKFEQPLVDLVAAIEQVSRYFVCKNALVCLLASKYYVSLILAIADIGVTRLESLIAAIACHQLGHFGGVKHLVAIQ